MWHLTKGWLAYCATLGGAFDGDQLLTTSLSSIILFSDWGKPLLQPNKTKAAVKRSGNETTTILPQPQFWLPLPGELWLARCISGSLPLRVFGIGRQLEQVEVTWLSCHPANNVKSTNEDQALSQTRENHPLASSTRLVTEGAMFPLCQLSDANTQLPVPKKEKWENRK